MLELVQLGRPLGMLARGTTGDKVHFVQSRRCNAKTEFNVAIREIKQWGQDEDKAGCEEEHPRH